MTYVADCVPEAVFVFFQCLICPYDLQTFYRPGGRAAHQRQGPPRAADRNGYQGGDGYEELEGLESYDQYCMFSFNA